MDFKNKACTEISYLMQGKANQHFLLFLAEILNSHYAITLLSYQQNNDRINGHNQY